MKLAFILFCLAFTLVGFSQQYDSVITEEEHIDANNAIYKTGNVFVYDYEIILKGKKYKLKTNNGMFASTDFELTAKESDSIAVNRIHLIVTPVADNERSNENQTQISYLQEPVYASLSSTGAVENDKNVWIHPIRKGFFNALETAPFPFVKKPLMIGSKWTDQMKIGQGWANDMWGTWEGQLLLDYTYEIVDKKKMKTAIGAIDCYVVESTATSNIGTTKLTSYFSKQYGFVRLEYELLNDLTINMWLIDFQTEKQFNDPLTFFKTKKYIKQ
ncbi:hypothetical protein ABN763_04325 [Spongiivirga sp. MCCC 1A20706]|uniref:hypothetical protein n=1 Tax=Spongiivirga sp. MCCC 1A20706 TaxID=3160963 RepID=UPI00397795F2